MSLFEPGPRAQIKAVLAHPAGNGRLAGRYQAVCRAHGITEDELRHNLDGDAADARLQAAIRYAHAVLITNGRLGPADAQRAVRAGLTARERAALVALACGVAARVIRANAAQAAPPRRWWRMPEALRLQPR